MLFQQYDKNINLVFTNPLFENLDRQFIETLLREEITVFGKAPNSSIMQLELEPYEIIKFDLSNLNHSQKMKIKNEIIGFVSSYSIDLTPNIVDLPNLNNLSRTQQEESLRKVYRGFIEVLYLLRNSLFHSEV